MRRFILASGLMVGVALSAGPTQAQSQSDYLEYVAECVRLFFADHAQHEVQCTPGPALVPASVVHARGSVTVVVTEEGGDEGIEEGDGEVVILY